VIHLENAQTLGTFEQDFYAGGPAITHNRFGQGNAFYVGTIPDQSGMDWLMDQVCKAAGVKPLTANLPAGVELVRRTNDRESWLFALNHSGEEVMIPLDRPGYEVLSGMKLDTALRLGPMDVVILQEESIS
jgi:beta-galactosidase